MTLRTEELKHRVISKQKALESRLAELAADAEGKAADEVARVKEKLDQLGSALKDGWDNLTDQTAGKLSQWLDRS